MSEVTIFERILAGDINASKVYEDEVVLAFKDIAPQAEVHVLVIPKRKARSLTEMAQECSATELGEFMKRLPLVAEKCGLSEYRTVFNTGEGAGQTVLYVHAHIMGGGPLGKLG